MNSRNNKHTVFLSYDGLTDPLGQSQVLPYLIGIAAKGYTVHLISFEKPERFSDYELLIRTLIKGKSIEWHPLKYTKKPPIFSTIFDIFKLKSELKRIVSSYDISLIHCRSYISTLAAQSISRSNKIPFIFDMRGFWADERVDGNLWNLKSPIYRMIYQFFKKKEIQFITDSAAIISLTNKAKEEISNWDIGNDTSKKITVIPCCCDLSLFNPKLENFSPKYYEVIASLSERKIDYLYVYLGAIGTWYLLDEMLQFFSVALDSNKHAGILFVTTENSKSINERAKYYNIPLDRIIITESPRAEVPQLLSLGNMGLFFIKPTYSKQASSPTKQAELMAMGLPIICNAGVGDTDWIVNKYKSGLLVKHFTEKDYSRVIEVSKNHIFDNKKIRAGADEYFSLTEGVKRYLKVYDEIINDDMTHYD